MTPELIMPNLDKRRRIFRKPSLTARGLAVLALGALCEMSLLPFSALGSPQSPRNALFITGPSSDQTARSEGTENDATLAPYFLVRNASEKQDVFPLKATSVKARISGVIADVHVTQRYENHGRSTLECIYVFPASTRAAVHGMRMTIGKRVIVAKIRRRSQARREYEDAKREGKSASLLEQQRPNVFQMNVANILPGDVVTVELDYTELLTPTERIYEFVFPTVVGPRYSNRPRAGVPDTEAWVANPYLHQGEPPPHTLDIKVELSTGLPLRDVACRSHQVSLQYEEANRASVRLTNAERWSANRDFILQYRLDGESIESGVLMYQGESENFFLAMVQPPERARMPEPPPREYIFVMDVSGSMHGYPIETSKTLLKDLVGALHPTDYFNVVQFAGGSAVLSETSLAATPANIQRAVLMIDNEHGGGGTEILPALKRAFALPRAEEAGSRSVVIATDGYVDVEPEVFELIRTQLDKCNVFAFGIGTSVNRFLLEGMARVGGGEPFIVDRPDLAAAKAAEFRKYVSSPILTQVRFQAEGIETLAVEPPQQPDLFADRPLVVVGKWRGAPKGTLRFSGITSHGPWSQAVAISEKDLSPAHAGLRRLWARMRIALLSDFNLLGEDDVRKREVTQLGLTYNLLTAFTSFVAIDRVVRSDGKVDRVVQPLPLPQGVSDYAVGGGMQSVVSGGVVAGVVAGSAADISSGKIVAITPAPLPPAPPPIAPVRVGGKIRPPRKLHDVQPTYPMIAKTSKIEGVVVVECTINETGRVMKTRIVKGVPMLNEAVIKAVEQWTYTPTLLNGVPIQVVMRVTVTFRLDAKGSRVDTKVSRYGSTRQD